MATEQKVVTLKNAEKTKEIFPRTKVSAVSDDNGTGLDTLLGNIDTKLNSKSGTDHTHTVDDITGLAATAAELNYCEGVTSNIQIQFDTINGSIGNISTALNSILGV